MTDEIDTTIERLRAGVLVDSGGPDLSRTSNRSQLAQWLARKGEVLMRAGRPVEALGFEWESLQLRVELFAADDRQLPGLAESLGSYAVAAMRHGLADSAVEAADAAVLLYRELGGDGGYADPLASALVNRGLMAYELGEPAAALPLLQEAAAIYGALPDRDDGLARNLGTVLNNITGVALELGLVEVAVAAARGSADVRRPLAERSPIDRAPYANALSTLADALLAAGDVDEALRQSRQARVLMGALATASPRQVRFAALTGADTHARVAAAAGLEEEAVAAAWEAIGHLRALRAEAPGRLEPMRLLLDRLAPALAAGGLVDEGGEIEAALAATGTG